MLQRSTGYLLLLLAWGLLASGCASMMPPVDPPNVTLESFSSLPAEGGGPRFLVKLRVQNPNEQPLDIAGISYTIDLVGKQVVTGVAKDIPVIEGYSEGVVSLEASLKMLQVLRLLASLGETDTDELTYKFVAKIDFKGLVPTQRVEEEGKITLN
ncbi:MAG: LEA type 2 family protein [Halioglobus sp.]|nr:LEA type 2 family protein [Halioglobus sp.]